MKNRCALILLLAALVGRGMAAPIPPEVRAKAFTVEPRLVRIAEATQPPPAWNPNVLKRRITAALATPLLTPTAQVDLFIQLQREAHMSFEGALPMPPKKNFPQFEELTAKFDQAVAADPKIELDVAPLLKIAHDEATSSTLRSANALLLSAYVDKKRTLPVLVSLLGVKELEKSQCPSVALYIYSRVATLCWNADVESAYIDLLAALPGEEDREVIICALGLHPTENGVAAIRETLLDQKVPVDFGFQTGLWVLRECYEPAEFTAFLDEAKKAATDPKRKESLEKAAAGEIAKAREFEFVKLWDGFRTSLYDDGYTVTFEPTGFVGILEKPKTAEKLLQVPVYKAD